MLAKILVGVVAAVAVTGAGVYYATHGCPFSQCCQQDTAPAASPSDSLTACSAEPELSCCSVKAIPVSEGASCCAAKTATSADGLGACVGGMAVTTSTSSSKKVHACCDE